MTLTNLLPGFLSDFILLDHRVEGNPRIRAAIAWSSGALRFPYRMREGQHGPGPAIWRGDLGKVFLTGPMQPVQTAGDMLVTPIVHDNLIRGFLTLDVVGSTRLQDEYKLLLFTPMIQSHAQLLASLAGYLQFSAWNLGVLTDTSQRVGQALAEVRRGLNITQSTLADMIGVSRIALSQWELGAQPPSEGPLCRWCTALGLLSHRQQAIVRVAEITPALVQMLRESPQRLQDLSPSQFEQFVAERLDRAGYNVTLTGSTLRKDGGIDIIAVRKKPDLVPFVVAVQAKHHIKGRPTGSAAVRDLLSWKGGAFHAGMLVTNTEFTRDARWAAAISNNSWFITLRDFQDLKKWLEDNFWSEENWREIPDEIQLAPGVSVQVPKPRLASPEALQPFTESDFQQATQHPK